MRPALFESFYLLPLIAAVAAKLPSLRISKNFAILGSLTSPDSLQSLFQMPTAELQSEISSSASTLTSVRGLCDDLISRCQRCDQMRTHEADLKRLATQVTALLDDATIASATLDSAIECHARACALASSKFLQLEFRLRALENHI